MIQVKQFEHNFKTAAYGKSWDKSKIIKLNRTYSLVESDIQCDTKKLL